MPEYKLYYFNGRGLGEVTRQLFAISNTPFEDVRVDHDKWLNDKALQEKMPFGQMPVLEVDGQLIPQSIAVARYVARKTGHAGKCPYEEAIVDALADQYKDYYVEIRPYYYASMGFPPTEPEKVEQLKKDVLIPARNKYFKYITAFLQKSSSGFLAGNDLTFADLILAEHVSTLKNKVPEYTEGFPEIEKHLQKIHNIPELKNLHDVDEEEDMATTDVDKFEMAPTTEHTVNISTTNRRKFAKRSRFPSRTSGQPKGKTTPGTNTSQSTVAVAPTDPALTKTDEEEQDFFDEILSAFGGFWFYAFIRGICNVSVLLAMAILHNTETVKS